MPSSTSFLASFGWADGLIIAAYLALMAGIGLWAARKRTDARGYFLAERAMPAWAVALSIVATSLSVATFVGGPYQSFVGDLTYLTMNLGAFLGMALVAAVFIPRFYRAGTVTIYGFLSQRYGRGAMVAVSCTFLLGRLLASGARLFIAAIPVCLLIFGSFQPSREQLALAICLIGGIGTAYTVAGGIRAVIWTDTAQILIVVGAAVLSIILLLGKIPISVPQILSLLADPHSGPLGPKLRLIDTSWDPSRATTLWTALIGSAFLNAAAYGVDHDLAQRMLTARSAWKGSLSLILAQIISTIVVALFMIIGLLLWVFYKRPDVMGAAAPHDLIADAKQVYPQFLLWHMPAGLSGLAIAGMLAAAQGSLDSAINAMASSAVADLYWPLRTWLGKGVESGTRAKAPRLAVLAMGALLILVAIGCVYWYDPSRMTLIEFALSVMAYAYTGMLGVFLTAMLTRRGNTASVFAALAAGVITTALLEAGAFTWIVRRCTGYSPQLAGFWWMPIGTVVAFVVCASVRSPAPAVSSQLQGSNS